MHLFSRRRASYTIETGLVLPVLTIVLSGVLDYGLFFNQHIAVTTAVREGARIGSTTAFTSNPVTAAVIETEARIEGALGTTSYTVTAELVGIAPNTILRVHASVPFTPYIGIASAPTSMEAELEMRLEDQ